MIRRLIILLLIVGCNNSNEPDEVSTYWRCGTICDGIWCWDSSFVEIALETCLPSGANRAHPWSTKSACEDYCGDTLIFSLYPPIVSCNGDTCSVDSLISLLEGLMPVNDIGLHPPYGTEFNDLQWTQWASEFEVGEWGWEEMDSMIWTGYVDSIGDTIIWGTPIGLNEYEIAQTGLIDSNGNPIFGTGLSEDLQHLILSPSGFDRTCFEYADSSCVEISD